MPNIKSQIKRVKTNDKRRQFNASFKASMRTATKLLRLLLRTKTSKLQKKLTIQLTKN